MIPLTCTTSVPLVRVIGVSQMPDEATGTPSMTTDALLTDLGASQTDLARIIETVVRDRPPFIVVAAQAVRAWERREPETWAKVTRWLGARSVAIVAV
jgi:hypothetical protein